ncbi:TlpA family protein disulfide reductase [Salisediminibacterium halotolerans]|uniref:TlpA family protein disulfide reductase n=2 Tax=Salisediminibacterium halotolerans TaxID=517425 RepID=UPI000EAE2904|nr:TlpA disulfide reductase family protein [Salisediminibacterium halotolerans]RLJ74126.1 peroxiredoxin [Actinophytocola xinjiangensis]RPE87781.1 peroxiredoxin [Salisediminibacterium halotolerans]TWG34963.1 peroxiredoxin [Salisediminibacterium halotolerans]GEL07702.1 hypothetical protein SHA02_11180 [Salisediminibacterium halotolerans]
MNKPADLIITQIGWLMLYSHTYPEVYKGRVNVLIMKRGLFLIMAVSVGFFLWLGQEQENIDDGQSVSYPQPGHEAPAFEAGAFGGGEYSWEEGQPAVLYFWTSWCPYCQASSEMIEEAHHRYGDEVEMIGVNVLTQDRQQDAETFIRENGLSFTNLQDSEGAISDMYYVPPVPTTVFIDEDGVISHRKTGAIAEGELTSEIRSLKGGGE